MSRAPRRSFLAPFILTAAAALPGCKSKGEDTTTVIRDNPPELTTRTWSVWAGETEGECMAEHETSYDCPPDASCNPPPPMTVACPEGMPETAVKITQVGDGPCMMDTAEGAVEVACPGETP